MTERDFAVLAVTVPAHDVVALAALIEAIAIKHEERRRRHLYVAQLLDARDNPHTFDGSLDSSDDDPDYCPQTGEALYV